MAGDIHFASIRTMHFMAANALDVESFDSCQLALEVTAVHDLSHVVAPNLLHRARACLLLGRGGSWTTQVAPPPVWMITVWSRATLLVETLTP